MTTLQPFGFLLYDVDEGKISSRSSLVEIRHKSNPGVTDKPTAIGCVS